MTAVVFAIIGLSAFLHSLRWAQARDVYIYAMAPFNYFTAAAVFIVWSAAAGIGFGAESFLYGCAVGLCYGMSFFLLLSGMRWVGVAKTTTVVNLAYVIPVIASIVIWGEKLTILLGAGIILGLIAIPLILLPSRSTSSQKPNIAGAMLSLGGLYVAQGAAYAIMKGFERLGRSEEKPLMLAGLFTTAAVYTLCVYIVKFRRPTLKDVYHGVITGGCNAFSNASLLSAVSIMAASVVFPTFTVGTIVLVTISSVFIWQERYSLRAWMGILLACVSIAMMNV